MKPITHLRGEFFFLSNFYPCVVSYDGENYPTVEHAYQAAKTLDPSLQKIIREAVQPGYAKNIGSRILLRPHWHEIRLEVMRSLVWKKFERADLRQKLLDTRDRELIEDNSWGDTFWGVCRGKGENNLGLILMNIRARVRGQAAIPIPAIQSEIQANGEMP